MTEGILTGEGVLLDSRPASFASRLLAGLLDVLVLGTVVIGIVVVLGVVAPELDEQTGQALLVVALVLVMVVVPTAVETLTRGRSLGKLAAGIRIVRDDGGPVRFRQAFVRALTGVGELWLTLASVALITSMVNDQGKRVGDILAGTYAVRVRGAVRTLPPLTMPPPLAGWARSADMGRLPDGLALSVRQFLGRAATLHPASRVAMRDRLTAEVARYVAPPPPPGAPPEAFLAAVLVERRDREYASASRAAEAARAEAQALQRLPHSVPDPVD
ncbi:RDD family protein [Cellulomonas sp. ATA003]|uniref:RDD family protein n=1 Tax=Cellulomonas sp. ATA003 TaxID=3073064 RepID=UPI002873354B|nr:RDD family protein [Cellulomonas sp. ATA003]WNB86360.1 RDD family protein [Cellulomonas sp. ATA003]